MCEYNGIRCRKPGAGNPPLCLEHYELMEVGRAADWEAMADRVVESAIHRIYQPLQDLFGDFVDNISQAQRELPPHMHPHYQGPGRAYAADTGSRQQGDPRRRRQAPPPREPPAASPQEDPRVILGFPAGSRPTKKEIKTRQRALAALYHPDQGGNTEAMQRVNNAAETLIRELGLS